VPNGRQQRIEGTRIGGWRWGEGAEQAPNPASKRQQASTVGRRVFPEPSDIVCGQQRADGNISLRTDEEVGEPKSEESGQGKTVSGTWIMRISEGLTKSRRSLSLRDVRDIKRLYLSGAWAWRDYSEDDETDDG